ncbi:CPCC family cysteine-rich protein [Flavobacterium sp. HJSW_4]|uniref:CPCC family cysteine-rich protein n=1 Tax=Flavobacterium sp. HJSW_4 TaxID=3344660 RepID=UPI0035F3452B
MERYDAKKTIAIHELKQMSDKEKLDILEHNYWFFGDKEGIKESVQEGSYPKISEAMIEIIDKTPKPFLNDESETLLVDYQVGRLKHVTNLYLQIKLKDLNPDFKEEIFGEIEKAGLCPCCEYFSIDYGEDGFYDICPVCFWENGGDGPNHMTLAEAKMNFQRFGAIDERSLKYVDIEGVKKYLKK